MRCSPAGPPRCAPTPRNERGVVVRGGAFVVADGLVKGAPAGSCWRFHKRLSRTGRPRRARVATRRPSRDAQLAPGLWVTWQGNPEPQSACSGVTQPSKPKLRARSLGCSGCSTRSALCCWSAAGRGRLPGTKVNPHFDFDFDFERLAPTRAPRAGQPSHSGLHPPARRPHGERAAAATARARARTPSGARPARRLAAAPPPTDFLHASSSRRTRASSPRPPGTCAPGGRPWGRGPKPQILPAHCPRAPRRGSVPQARPASAPLRLPPEAPATDEPRRRAALAAWPPV
jgi:hypothetical protein